MRVCVPVLTTLLGLIIAVSATAEPISPILSLDPIAIGPRMLVRATFPVQSSSRPFPIVILSHGDRLSRNDYRSLVEAWARGGFLVLQPGHADAAIDGIAPQHRVPDAWHRRIDDIKQVLDHLSLVERRIGHPVDRQRIAIAGHSLGGFTAEAMIGARIPDSATGRPVSFADPRIKAALLLAPPGGADGLVPEWKARAPYLAADFATMHGPLLEIAGNADDGTMSRAGVGWRMQPYRDASPGGKCLIVVAGAGHYLGGINGPYQPPVDIDPARLALVRDASTAFLLSALDPADPAWRRFLAAPRSTAASEISCK